MRHQRIINHLRLIAQDVIPIGSARIAAGIVYRNKLIAIGTCKYKSHPFQARFSKNEESIYFHAEIDAIHNAVFRLNKEGGNTDFLKRSSLYIVRQRIINKQWKDGVAKPCLGCQKAIDMYELKNIWWTENET